MSESTNVENNNEYIACVELKPKEKRKGLEIETGNYGKKGQDGDYIINLTDGKIVHPDDRAKSKVEQYKKNVEKITRYENKVKEEDREI